MICQMSSSLLCSATSALVLRVCTRHVVGTETPWCCKSFVHGWRTHINGGSVQCNVFAGIGGCVARGTYRKGLPFSSTVGSASAFSVASVVDASSGGIVIWCGTPACVVRAPLRQHALTIVGIPSNQSYNYDYLGAAIDALCACQRYRKAPNLARWTVGPSRNADGSSRRRG